MKVISKIRAFFTMRGKQEQMDLTSAEIRRNGVYLHPAEDSAHTYFVKTDEVDIIIKPGAEITEEDIFVQNRVTDVEPEDPVHEMLSEEQMSPEPAFPSHDTPPKNLLSEVKMRPNVSLLTSPQMNLRLEPDGRRQRKKALQLCFTPTSTKNSLNSSKKTATKRSNTS